MYVNGIGRFQYSMVASLCWIFFFVPFILLVDSVQLGNPAAIPQICSKLQSMLSFGKYETSQISSNITYVPRIYTQNFLAYSSIDDLLLFIEPKHQIHIYDAQTVQLIVNISTTDVIIATSCTSLISESPHELYFIYANHSLTNIITLRVCQVRFNIYRLDFDQNYCIEPIILQYDQPNLRIYGFTIKRDHAGTTKSLLFVSTQIGLIYTIFDTKTGVLQDTPLVLNETSNEGSVVLSSSGSIYFASKQEHLIYELRVTNDFRLTYGNVTKGKAIKSPYGLITDECHHLYIATRSTILIMYTQESVTIRSVFSKASDLPITLERLNATTYVYATINQKSKKSQPYWMFNFLYFTEPEKHLPPTRHPVINLEEIPEINITEIDNIHLPRLWPLSYSVLSITNMTKMYTQFFSTPRKPFALFKKRKMNIIQTNSTFDQENSSSIDSHFSMSTSSDEHFDENSESDEDLQLDYSKEFDSTLDHENGNGTKTDSIQHILSDSNSSTQSLLSDSREIYEDRSTTIDPHQSLMTYANYSAVYDTNENLSFRDDESLFDYLMEHPVVDLEFLRDTNNIHGSIPSNDDLRLYFKDRTNLTDDQIVHIETYLIQRISSDPNLASKYITSTKRPTTPLLHDNSSLPENKQTDKYSEELSPLDFDHFNHTTASEDGLFSFDELQSYLQGNRDLSPTKQEHIEAYLAKEKLTDQNKLSQDSASTPVWTAVRLVDEEHIEAIQLEELLKNIPETNSDYYNLSTDSEEILISKDDLRSYIQGEGMLSKTQEAQFQAYVAKQQPSDQHLFTKYLTTTTTTTTSSSSETHIQSQLPIIQEQILDENNKENDDEHGSNEKLLFEFEKFNRTNDIEDGWFTANDLQAYLHGEANLTTSQQVQIERFLAKQPAFNRSLFTKRSTTTTTTVIQILTTTMPSDENIDENNPNAHIDVNEILGRIPSPDSEHFNITIGSEEVLISKDDLRSYLEGRGNLSEIQRKQIEDYFAQQSSSNQETSSNSSITMIVSNESSTSSVNANLFISEKRNDTQSPDYSSDLLPLLLEHFNRSTEAQKNAITSDDLRLYLQGERNLSDSKQEQIKEYLNKELSVIQNMPSKYSTSTVDSYDSIDDNGKNEDKAFDDLFEEISATDSLSYNSSITSEEISISKDNLRLYLQGRGNLSKIQQDQIETYLATQSPSYKALFSNYMASTTQPTKSSTIHITQSQLLPLIIEHFNRTTNTQNISFTFNDLQSYLEGKANLSELQKENIKEYLNQQSSPLQNIISQYAQSTKQPSSTVTSMKINDKELDDLIEKIPLSDSEEILISKDDIRSYLEGDRSNLSKSQEEKIQVYLEKQMSSDKNIFSKYFTTTTDATHSSISDTESKFPIESEDIQSIIDSPQIQEHLPELLPLIFEHLNRSNDPENQLPFTGDDLQSFLQGHGNLSISKTEQIKEYLNDKSSPLQNIISQYSKNRTRSSTIIPTTKSIDAGDTDNEDTELENLLQRIPAFNSNYLNISSNTEQVLISKDDIRSYLQGHRNLSKIQETQIQNYFEKQSPSDQTIFFKYLTTTSIPANDKLHETYQQKNNSLTDKTYEDDQQEKLQPFNFGSSNSTVTSEEMLFSFDELQSYLQGNRTFSPVKQANIQTYLAKQSSTNRNILSHPSITTQSPSKTNSSLEDISTNGRNEELEEKFKDLLRKILQIDPEEKLISKVDLLSFIEGRSNLTKDQQAQLQAYIAKESPTNQETFSKYLTGTTKTPRITTVGIDNDTEHSAAKEDSEDIEEDEKSKDMPSLDLELLNRTIAAENGSFTPNDLQAYLQGQSNLTTIQQIQIKDFLVKQPSFNRSVFITRSTTTRLSTTTKPSDVHVDDDNKDENISIDDLLDKISSTDSEHFNITTGSEEILISKDDLRSYLEGERNLSEVQQAQIKTYLAKQASSDQQIFSKYLTSTSTRKVPSKLEVNKNSESNWAHNDSLRDDTQKIDHSEETFNADGKLFNYTIESDKMPFTANELNSYLQGQGNISLSQQQKIEDYLAKKKTTSSMAIPTEIPPSDNNIDNKQPDEEINLEEIINGLSQVDSYSLNYSNDSEPILISKDDLRSYLRGKGNLSKVQETHIQAYLATQSPSKVATSVTPHINIESLFRKGRNNSSTNNTQEEEEYSQKLLLSILGNYNRTTDDEIKSFNIDDLRSYMQGQANISLDKQAQIRSYLAEQLASNENILSETTTAPIQIATLFTTEQDANKVDDTKFQELLNKIPSVGSQYFNFTTDLDEPILISKDDVLSYVQGRSNLSTSQEQQLQHFLSKLSIVDQTLFSNYMASTTQPTKSSTIHITQSQLLPLIIEHFNRTTNTQNISFTFNDLQSYLEGKANLSELQKENIKEYLNQQSSPLQNIISQYAQSTKQPSSTVTSMKINDKELDDLIEKIPLSDSEEILISKDDIRSYLEGDRSNLSKSQEEKIQVYLEKQMSSDKNIFSKYFTTTTDATHSSISDTNIDLSNQRVRNHTLTNDTSTQTYLPELLPMILEHFILSNDTDKKHLFTSDDLKSFLHGHGNLTLSKIKQIKDYLADQSVAIQNISSHYLKGTAESFNSSTPNDKLPEHKQPEEKALSDLLEKLPSIDFEDLTITKDDLRSYLQGQRNLSKVQESQIEAYLAKQSSSDQNLLSKYISSATTLSTTSTSSVIDKSTHSYKGKSTSGAKDTHSNRSSKKGQITTAGYAKPTTAFEESLFFFDDLRAYLQGRRNLSPAKIAGIQAYLAKQAASNQTLSSSYFTTTPAPTNISSLSTKMPDNHLSKDLELDDLLRKIPLIDSKYYNLSTTSEEVLILKDDLESYLKGERNLSIIQETQFQMYLSKQPLSDQRLFSNYLTKIKESDGRSTVDMDRKFELNKETNGTITEDKLVEDDSKELLPLDLEYFNQTVGSEGILFTLDDLQLFLQGRGNLTPAQIEQIRAYLAQQKASNRSIFSKYSKSPHGDFVTSDEDAQNDEMNLEEFLKKILIYLKDLNISSDAEKALFSINNIRAYLQGRLNLSKSDETKMQSTLNKYSSLGNSTLNTSNTTLSFAPHSRLWSPFSRSKENSSTSTRSSKSLSEIDKTKTSTTTTTTSSWEKSSIDPKLTRTSSDITESSSSELSTVKKTNTFITSEMPRVASTTAQFDKSSLRSDYPQSKSTIASILFDSTKKQTFQQELDQSTPKSSDSHLTSSRFRSSEISTSTTTLSPTITPYSTTLVVPDRSSLHPIVTSSYRDNLKPYSYFPLPSTPSPWLTDRYQYGFTPERPSFDSTSTLFPYFDAWRTSSTYTPPSFDQHEAFTTTTRRFRSRKQKIIRWQTQSSLSTSTITSSTTMTSSFETTTSSNYISTSTTSVAPWYSSDQQQTIVIKPPSNQKDSNTSFSNDLLNQILQNISSSSNSSVDKSIFVDLIDCPSSSWNLSFKSNESFTLDVALPSPIDPLNSTTITNLTFTTIEAERFSTNIMGKSVHFRVDRVHAKEFYLKMNDTDKRNRSAHGTPHLSDVVIGHVTSEQFHLNLSQSDKVHVHVQQVDTATAELYLDSNFCTNDSSLEINLNLSKNGTIHYGNQTPIHIGPVFTRVYMPKQSCDRDQPLTLFFDICERQNPCSNDGTCIPLMPDYNDTSYSPTETGHIGYKCNCPLHTTGEHCQILEYPLGYCLNGGTFFQIYDRFNQSIEKCLCAADFYGPFCEEYIDNCIGVSCSNHGICLDDIETYKCACFDGFYGAACERKRMQTVILEAASRSFGIIAILLIGIIACLVVASDIHTYAIRRQQRKNLLSKFPRVTSEILENSVLLLGFGDAPIEMNELSKMRIMRRGKRPKYRSAKRTVRIRKTTGNLPIAKRKLPSKFSEEPQLLSIRSTENNI